MIGSALFCSKGAVIVIEVIVGYQGSGKTFKLVNLAYKAIKQGRKVFTNVRIKGAYKLTFDDLINYTFPPGSVVLIDEVGRWFSSRKWSQLPDDVFDLFTLERHLQLDLTVAVQNFNRIDKALREVIEWAWWARNYPLLPYFVYEGYADVEHLGLKGQALKKQYLWKFSRSRKLYDTHGMATAINKDFMPEIPWDWEDEIPKTKGLKSWIFRYFIPKSKEESPSDLGECLACEVDPDKAAVSLDSEVKPDV